MKWYAAGDITILLNSTGFCKKYKDYSELRFDPFKESDYDTWKS